jgi:hypothetical protein
MRQKLGNLLLLSRAQFTRPAGMRTGPQPFGPPSFGTLHPLAHRYRAHIQRCGNILLLPARLLQFQGMQMTALFPDDRAGLRPRHAMVLAHPKS